MEDITVRRTLDSPPEAVGDAMLNLEPFMKAAGFDQVEVENDLIYVANQVGIATIELTLEIVDDPDADLSYVQREGIFEEMRTTYIVEPTATGTEISATTQFALDVAIVGNVLDSTIIKRQRRKELTAQFDWLEEVCSD
jgi:hypothetical protein